MHIKLERMKSNMLKVIPHGGDKGDKFGLISEVKLIHLVRSLQFESFFNTTGFDQSSERKFSSFYVLEHKKAHKGLYLRRLLESEIIAVLLSNFNTVTIKDD